MLLVFFTSFWCRLCQTVTRVKKGSYVLCIVLLKPFIVELCFKDHKIGKKNKFLGDIPSIAL